MATQKCQFDEIDYRARAQLELRLSSQEEVLFCCKGRGFGVAFYYVLTTENACKITKGGKEVGIIPLRNILQLSETGIPFVRRDIVLIGSMGSMGYFSFGSKDPFYSRFLKTLIEAHRQANQTASG